MWRPGPGAPQDMKPVESSGELSRPPAASAYEIEPEQSWPPEAPPWPPPHTYGVVAIWSAAATTRATTPETSEGPPPPPPPEGAGELGAASAAVAARRAAAAAIAWRRS